MSKIDDEDTRLLDQVKCTLCQKSVPVCVCLFRRFMFHFFVVQVSELHTDMVKWMIQMLLRLAPDPENLSEEAKEAAVVSRTPVPQLVSQASSLSAQVQLLTKRITK